ncbi:MAG: hypothetical protein KJ566_03330 [Nanoarchaeota archaeon]|nr:hypothetical protein [Nanoarchaeota archaeon]
MNPYQRNNRKKNKIKWIVIILIILAMASLWEQDKIQDFLAGNYFFGGIVDNHLESKNMSSLVFEEINSIRNNKTIEELEYNKNSYNLAVAIAKKFYKSKTYSLNDSELGKMSKLYKVDNVKFLSRKLEQLDKSNFDMLSNDWTIRDLFTEHTLNTMYTDGAVGCYKEVCVFILNIKMTPAPIYNYDINPKKEIPKEESKDNEGFIQEIIKEGEKMVNEVIQDDPEKYKIEPKTINLVGVGDYVVYKGVNDYLSSLDRSISYYYDTPTTKDFILKDLNNNVQKIYLDTLVNKIKDKSDNSNEQARIAIRIVQKIPYDYEGLYGVPEGRLPYEVIYDMKGVCGEKSELLAFLLRELGFGVAIFEFNVESHRAVGIKCPNCDYKSSGYCFIESTVPTIPTDSEGEYLGAGKLGSPSEIIYVADGKSLDLSKECSDAKAWNNLLNKGEYLNEYDYNQWLKFVKDYGMEIEESEWDEGNNYYDLEFKGVPDYEIEIPEIEIPSVEFSFDEPYCPPLTKSELLNCHSISRDSRCPKSKTELLCN